MKTIKQLQKKHNQSLFLTGGMMNIRGGIGLNNYQPTESNKDYPTNGDLCTNSDPRGCTNGKLCFG